MKQKTAISQLIDILEKHILWIEGNHKADRVDIYDVAAKAIELKLVNEQQIKDAWKDGGSTLSSKNATLYFNDTFERTD